MTTRVTWSRGPQLLLQHAIGERRAHATETVPGRAQLRDRRDHRVRTDVLPPGELLSECEPRANGHASQADNHKRNNVSVTHPR
jgi:hypothetical protein